MVAVDTFFVGVLKGFGKVYLQTAIDCCSRHAWARLYPNKLPLTAVQLINDDVLPTFDAHRTKIDAVPTMAASSAVAKTAILTSCFCSSKTSNTSEPGLTGPN